MKALVRSCIVISSLSLSAVFLSACNTGADELSGGLTEEDEKALDAAATKLDAESIAAPPVVPEPDSAAENAQNVPAKDAPAK